MFPVLLLFECSLESVTRDLRAPIRRLVSSAFIITKSIEFNFTRRSFSRVTVAYYLEQRGSTVVEGGIPPQNTHIRRIFCCCLVLVEWFCDVNIIQNSYHVI